MFRSRLAGESYPVAVTLSGSVIGWICAFCKISYIAFNVYSDVAPSTSLMLGGTPAISVGLQVTSTLGNNL